MLEPLVRRHLKQHGDDAEKRLAAFDSAGKVREILAAVPDPDIEASLGHLRISPEPDAESTTNFDGRPVGDRYRVVRPHARGHLGLVSIALDAELHREVALKEIQSQRADEPVSRARFLLEAEITGRLEHPGVVPVYGMGTHRDGRPFYAMRFVRGDTLKEALSTFHDADADPKRDPIERSLSLRKMLNRFVAVCEAMHYAHSRGVIHRDIKPANILLGPYGETFVADWGLAKIVGRGDPSAAAEATIEPSSGSGTTETQAGAAVGTPAYMSPEQAEGKHDAVGPRSDVFGLGATLYALLTGEAPIRGSDSNDALHQAQRGSFPPPRQVKPRVPKGLEAIVLKAMALKPEDRYQSGRALAEDIEHWQNDAPLTALPESWSQRLGRWMRQHRSATRAAAVALIVITAVSIGSVLLIDQARRGEQQALGQTKAALARAEDREKLATDAVKKFRDAVVNNPDLKDREDLKPLRDTLLKEPLEFFKTLRDQLQSSRDTRPESLARLASALFDLGFTTYEIGDREDALRAFEEALAINEHLAREHPTVTKYQSGLAVSHEQLSSLRHSMGQSVAALESYQQALTINERLAREHPTVKKYQFDLAESHRNLGNPQGATGVLADLEALAINERPAWEDLTVTTFQSDVGITLNNLARIEMARKSWKTARKQLPEAVEYQRRALRAEPRNPTYRHYLAGHLVNLAQTYLALRRPEEAVQATRESAELMAGDANGLYSAACFQALCAGMAGEEMADERMVDNQKKYADEAMTTIRAAVTAGWSNASDAAHDPYLVPLRGRADFRHFVAELFDRGFPKDPFAK